MAALFQRGRQGGNVHLQRLPRSGSSLQPSCHPWARPLLLLALLLLRALFVLTFPPLLFGAALHDLIRQPLLTAGIVCLSRTPFIVVARAAAVAAELAPAAHGVPVLPEALAAVPKPGPSIVRAACDITIVFFAAAPCAHDHVAATHEPEGVDEGNSMWTRVR